MAGAAVTFLSVTLAHVILRLRVAREIIGFLSLTDTYIYTYKLFPRFDAELKSVRVHLAPENTTVKTVYANRVISYIPQVFVANGVPAESSARSSEQGVPGVLAGVMFSQARTYRCVKLTVKL